MSNEQFKKYLATVMYEYFEYEEARIEEIVSNGGPRPEGVGISFVQFYTWLLEGEK